jgi:outer membrane lipoprotein-sorting protein
MKKISIICLFLLITVTFNALAQNVDEIVQRANNKAFYQGKDGKAQVEMTITDSQGRTRRRQFTILRMDITDGGEQKYYVYFSQPPDVRDMVYMVWKHPGSDDDRWLYLPALDLVRRIAASDKRSSFVGSDFLYEDISGRALSLDEHQLVSSEGDAYKVKNTPKNPKNVKFSYYYVYIDKQSFLPTKSEYYNNQGELYRIIEALKIETIQGYPTIVKMKATDLTTGSSTVSEFSQIEYDINLSQDIFSERYLRRPPMRWIK